MSAYKDEEHGTWYVKFAFVDWTGKIRWTTKRGFDGKRKAERYEREYKQRSRNQQPDITVSKLVQYYLEDRKLHLRENSYRSRESAITPSLDDN